ncbi:hypothetical protein ZOSMA_223G00410 [Zostera marina]|uniref:Uncharacterized protein n=1 Tax=Zostera marina TaxID=29655 RepID=A0A0K9PJ97_ZOSMR|nr:hypothetical protein ZOSMA_223G00410 [Zostera marina]
MSLSQTTPSFSTSELTSTNRSLTNCFFINSQSNSTVTSSSSRHLTLSTKFVEGSSFAIESKGSHEFVFRPIPCHSTGTCSIRRCLIFKIR